MIDEAVVLGFIGRLCRLLLLLLLTRALVRVGRRCLERLEQVVQLPEGGVVERPHIELEVGLAAAVGGYELHHLGNLVAFEGLDGGHERGALLLAHLAACLLDGRHRNRLGGGDGECLRS